MMKKSIFWVLIACVSLLFSSCIDDTWTNGRLDFTMRTITNVDGYFEKRIVVYTDDMELDDYASFINHYTMERSLIDVIGDFRNGDGIADLELDIDGVGVYRFPSIIELSLQTSITPMNIADSYYDTNFDAFMYRAFNRMSNVNKMDIIISGYVINRNNSPVLNCDVDFDFYNDLNVNVRQ